MTIKEQEEKIQLLRKRWVEASPMYKKFIEAAGKIEVDKLKEMVDKNGETLT